MVQPYYLYSEEKILAIIRDIEVKYGKMRHVVEVGSEAIPAAFCAKRGLKEDEIYFSISQPLKERERRGNIVGYERSKYGSLERFVPFAADCTNLPFPAGCIDEMIFNNVFGSYYHKEEVMASFLREASRVLRCEGKIHVTEMNTPNFIPDTWFTGGRPERGKNASANEEYFQHFGLGVRRLSTCEEDIRYFREPFPGESGFYTIAFTLTLEKKVFV